MPHDEHIGRRKFLGCLGAGAILGATGLSQSRLFSASPPAAWTPPPVLKNPNILIIMVDQMRPPMWMSASQSAALSQSILPNIMGRIQNCSYNFGQFFVAATACTPSRACLLTGLYPPQTAIYATAVPANPVLNPAFPTWGQALTVLNPVYQGNVWWFGKWHLSNPLSDTANTAPLLPYGFNTRTYPGGPSLPNNPSPDGAANEGTDGGRFGTLLWANDAMIASDFIDWMQGQAPTTGQPKAPWCATVSLINPHDITYAAGYLQNNPFPPPNPYGVYFPPPTSSGSPPSFYSALPSPWNYENLAQVPNKPVLQSEWLQYINQKDGAVTDYVLLLNQYFWLQNLVDQQVGLILNALASSASASNTVVIFLSDHGEYAGSHGLHTKGFSAYDESMRVPFYVQFPGQTSAVCMNQMCSAVDVFGLICDLATGGSGQWMLAYPDLANRQSMWSFLYNNSSETRVAPGPIGLPYVLHTCDEGNAFSKPHITCLRTKLDLNAGAIGAKLAFYSNWASCTTYPDSTPPDPEFYDYNPQTTDNASEMGNDYFSNNATTQNTIEQHQQALGSWGPPGTGIIGSELNAPLIGKGTDGNPLSQAQATSQQTYFTYVGSSGCTSTKG